MQPDILPRVIFSPGVLALGLAAGLEAEGASVTLFTPGDMKSGVKNVTADLSGFEAELELRGDSYIELLKKHPLVFISMARQVQSELIAKAFEMANANQLDVVHIYTNEEDIALPFARFCTKPVVFTHHDPFNFATGYRHVFPKYAHLNWISMSMSQRAKMPPATNWVGNIYHGMVPEGYAASYTGNSKTLVYLGRIVEPKGVHLAIRAVKKFNETADAPYTLKIAGKHYSGTKKDGYWAGTVEPLIDGKEIQYIGFISDPIVKQEFLREAAAIIVPSTFDEPFGMVMIEALAAGTPIIGLDSGAIPEVVIDGVTGIVVPKVTRLVVNPRSGNRETRVDDVMTSNALAEAIGGIHRIDRRACRTDFMARFTLKRMAREHLAVYEELARG
jgi:glycosyltransferase involved in cell wall biosynthesis